MDSKTYDGICRYLEYGDYPEEVAEISDKAKAKNLERAFRRKCEHFVLKKGQLLHVPSQAKPNLMKEVAKEKRKAGC